MGEYTIDIRHLLQRGYKLSLDSYPIWSEEYRPYLNQKITDHFMFREIGQETPDRFNFFLQRKMNEIMPYYNKLYESELIQFDPLATEFFKEGTEGRRNRDYESQSKNRSKRGETTGDVYSRNEDNKHDQTFGQVSGEKVKGAYSKQGDKTVDTTGKRVEDLHEETEGNELVTNNLHTKTVADGTAEGTVKKTGTQNTVFSDIPQAGVETTTVTAPDGTVTTTTKGYATTQTNVSSSENTNTTDKTHSQTDTDNTGTVNTDTTGTKNNTNVIDTTENEETDWHESGSNTQDTDYTNDETTNLKTNTKEDSERNIAVNEKKSNDHNEHSKTGENTSEIYTGKGRKGANPSELIIKYRQALLNIDMMVIGELETLFMGVY